MGYPYDKVGVVYPSYPTMKLPRFDEKITPFIDPEKEKHLADMGPVHPADLSQQYFDAAGARK